MKIKTIKLKISEDIPKRLRECREFQGVTVSDLGISQSTVSTIETKQYKDIKLSTLVKYLKGLGIGKLELTLD